MDGILDYRKYEKVKLGKVLNMDLTVDFGDLFKFKGERRNRILLDRIISSIIFLVSFGVIIFASISSYGDKSFSQIWDSFKQPEEFLTILIFIMIYPIIYSVYLFRNRNILADNLERSNLRELIPQIKGGEIESLEIENFYASSVINPVDQIYFKNPNFFLTEFTKVLFRLEFTKMFFEKRLGVNFKDAAQKILFELHTVDNSFQANYQMFFLRSFALGLEAEVEKIEIEFFVLVFARYYWNSALRSFGINELELEGVKLWYKNEKIEELYRKKWNRLSKLKPVGPINRSFTSRSTPILDKFGTDLTAQAVVENKFITSIGKDSILNAALKILEKQTGSAVMFYGLPGVGKTRLLEHIATRMVVEDVPDSLKDKRLVAIDLNRAMAMSSSIDDFKNSLQNLFEEVKTSKNIVLAFEEIGQIFEIREEGQMEIVNLISNIVNQNNLKIVATASLNDYFTRIKPSTGFASIFDFFEVPEPVSNLSFQILMDYAGDLEVKNKIGVEVAAVRKIIEYGTKIPSERSMPDKGINLLEEAVVIAKNKGLKFLSENEVNPILESKLGVKIGEVSAQESEKLNNLENIMHERVVGQEEAISSVAVSLKRARAGLSSGKRPVASFLFFGPTGVGKTEVAKTLAAAYFGDERLMIRVDMSEFQEEKNLDRLIGYRDDRGDFVGGFLTEQVRNKPFSLVLLDEIEKANPKVLDIFLQILDDGRVTDGMGRVVDFTNTIIIATSNAGSRKIAEGLSNSQDYNEIRSVAENELRNVFRVEFLNRFDRMIMFRYLTQVEIGKVAEIGLKNLAKRIQENQGVVITWSQDLVSELAQKGYDPVYGARELRRIIQDEIEGKLAELIIAKKVSYGAKVHFDSLGNVRLT